MSRRNPPLGDPYGNRTRVSAVEPRSPLKTTTDAVSSAETGPCDSNGLRAKGQPFDLESHIPILARAIGRTPEAVRDACERVNGRAVGVGVFEESE